MSPKKCVTLHCQKENAHTFETPETPFVLSSSRPKRRVKHSDGRQSTSSFCGNIVTADRILPPLDEELSRATEYPILQDGVLSRAREYLLRLRKYHHGATAYFRNLRKHRNGRESIISDSVEYHSDRQSTPCYGIEYSNGRQSTSYNGRSTLTAFVVQIPALISERNCWMP